MVKVQRTQRAEPEITGRRTQDILGLILFFLGAASLLCLCWQQTAPLPHFVEDFLRLIAGIGAYAIPLLLMFLGTMLLIGYERLSFTHSTYGTLLLFFVFITGRHLFYIPSRTQDVKLAGGWLGALFGSPLHTHIGDPISYLFLGLLTAVAVVLLVDQPFIETLRQMQAQSKAGVRTVHRGINKGLETGRAVVPVRASKTKVLEPALAEDPERAQRAARVVERALAPAKGNGKQIAMDLEADEEEEPSTASKLFRMFGLSRAAWRGEDPEENALQAGEAPQVSLLHVG